LTPFDQCDIDEARRGFRFRLRRRGLSPAFIERHADDLFGQALLELSRVIAEDDKILKPVGWLINGAWWRTINLLDQEKRRPQTASVDAFFGLASDAPTPEDETLKLSGYETVKVALRLLPPTEQRLIEFIYVEGMSCRAAGRRVGWGKSAADRHHQAALSRLRPVFEAMRRGTHGL
jgi:RNA polymerase sigma factor (sigma-70 family)